MRPTTAINDNVFDFQALLHPGTVFEHPKDVVDASGPDAGREASDPGFLGLRCIGDRVLSGATRSGRTEGAGQHRRHPGSPVRPGRRASPSAGREGLQTAVHRARHRGLDH